jgi:hypothetical protein
MVVKRVKGSDLFDDAKQAAKVMGNREAQYLLDMYLFMLKRRVAITSKINKSGIDSRALNFLLNEIEIREKNAKVLLDTYSDNHPIGAKMKEVKGIGPVISAGILAHVDMNRAPSYGHILSYGGFNPHMVWGKGEKRPFCAEFRSVLLHTKRAFQFLSGNPTSYFGMHYKRFKAEVIRRNEAGEMKEAAATKLAKFNYRKETKAYQCYIIGKLPPAHITQLAGLKALKLFIGCLHHYWSGYLGRIVPLPYAVEYMGHTDIMTMEEVIAFEARQMEKLNSGLLKKDIHMQYEAWKKEYCVENDMDIPDEIVMKLSRKDNEEDE